MIIFIFLDLIARESWLALTINSSSYVVKKKKRRHALPLMCGKKSHSIIFFCWSGQPKIVRFFLFLCYFLGDKNKRESPPLRNCNGFSLSLLVREHTRTHGTDSSDKTQFFLVAIAEKEAGFCVCVCWSSPGRWLGATSYPLYSSLLARLPQPQTEFSFSGKAVRIEASGRH